MLPAVWSSLVGENLEKENYYASALSRIYPPLLSRNDPGILI